MKAVITKSQFDRIQNFINETRELSKKQLNTFDIEGDDLSDLRNMRKISKVDEDSDCGCGGSEENDTRYMFFSNLQQMIRQAQMLLDMDEDMIEDLLNNGHDWAADHIAEAKNNMDQVYDFITGEMNGEGEDDSWGYEEKEQLSEAVYHGKKVTLNKPFLTPDGPKKRSVYVKNDKGNIVKVNFGDPNMRIKKNIPERRKSFRARMHCDNPGPKWKSNYWSCRAW